MWQLWWCPGISVASLGQQGLVCHFLWQTSTLPCALLWRGEEVDCVLCWKFQVDSCWWCGGGGDVVMELTIPVVSPDPCRAAMNVLLLAEVTNRWVSQARAEQIPFKFLVREVIVTVNSIPIITSNCYWIAQMLWEIYFAGLRKYIQLDAPNRYDFYKNDSDNLSLSTDGLLDAC